MCLILLRQDNDKFHFHFLFVSLPSKVQDKIHKYNRTLVQVAKEALVSSSLDIFKKKKKNGQNPKQFALVNLTLSKGRNGLDNIGQIPLPTSIILWFFEIRFIIWKMYTWSVKYLIFINLNSKPTGLFYIMLLGSSFICDPWHILNSILQFW